MQRTKLSDRALPEYTKGEEIFNMVSHIVGAALGVVALVLCVVFSAISGSPWAVVSSCIYGAVHDKCWILYREELRMPRRYSC